VHPFSHYDILLLILDTLKPGGKSPDLGFDRSNLPRIFHIKNPVYVEARDRENENDSVRELIEPLAVEDRESTYLKTFGLTLLISLEKQ
jgi:hypothetical protein